MRVSRHIYTLAVMVMILAIPFFVYSLEENQRMDTGMFDSVQRPGAVFNHDDHNANADLEDDCSTCHHVYDGKQKVADESSEDSPCSDCHALKASDENTVPLRMAYHKRCRSCHVDMKKGPLLCGQCHTRK